MNKKNKLRAELLAIKNTLIDRHEAEKREHAAFLLAHENLTAFWEITGNKYKYLGELMKSPEAVALNKLWTGELGRRYPRFADFLQSPEGTLWHRKYFQKKRRLTNE